MNVTAKEIPSIFGLRLVVSTSRPAVDTLIMIIVSKTLYSLGQSPLDVYMQDSICFAHWYYHDNIIIS